VSVSLNPVVRGGGISIARVMMIVALVAGNLALLREVPWEFRCVPTIWVLLGIADFVILAELILHRRLRAGHYTFLIVLVISYLVLAYQVAMERIHPMGPLVRGYQHITGDLGRNVWLLEISRLGDFWMACALGIVMAWGCAILIDRLERRRGWDIAAVIRGALLGFGISIVFATLNRAAGLFPSERAEVAANLIGLAICVIVGGTLGHSYLRSQRSEGRDAGPADPAPVP
jgi:hypothetical protein